MVLRIFYWNCASGLIRKLDFIKDLIAENNLDAIFIAESEIRSNFDLSLLSLDGYDLVLSNTYLTRGNSRLICLKKTDMKTVAAQADFDEIIALEKDNLTFIGVYRPFKTFDLETERSNFDRLFTILIKH